jgi:hypothetical protein
MVIGLAFLGYDDFSMILSVTTLLTVLDCTSEYIRGSG